MKAAILGVGKVRTAIARADLSRALGTDPPVPGLRSWLTIGY
jgi:hypothetical protein